LSDGSEFDGPNNIEDNITCYRFLAH